MNDIQVNETKQSKDRETAKKHYIKKITENPEYRTILNDRTKARQEQQRLLNPPKPRGRPKTAEPKVKKPNGRPRKYFNDIIEPINLISFS